MLKSKRTWLKAEFLRLFLESARSCRRWFVGLLHNCRAGNVFQELIATQCGFISGGENMLVCVCMVFFFSVEAATQQTLARFIHSELSVSPCLTLPFGSQTLLPRQPEATHPIGKVRHQFEFGSHQSNGVKTEELQMSSRDFFLQCSIH